MQNTHQPSGTVDIGNPARLNVGNSFVHTLINLNETRFELDCDHIMDWLID
jgi:hypothetical protein